MVEFLKTWSLRSNSVTRQVSFNRTKIGRKCQNSKYSNATFWVIFKQCDLADGQSNMKFLIQHITEIHKYFDCHLPKPIFGSGSLVVISEETNGRSGHNGKNDDGAQYGDYHGLWRDWKKIFLECLHINIGSYGFVDYDYFFRVQ